VRRPTAMWDQSCVRSTCSEYAPWLDAVVIGHDSGQMVVRFEVDVIDRDREMVVIRLRRTVRHSFREDLAGTWDLQRKVTEVGQRGVVSSRPPFT
jgi:hypothetical protein